MQINLIRFWFTLTDLDDILSFKNYGVTAYNYDDAIQLLKRDAFANGDLPKIKSVIENVNVSTLDKNHIIPNMLPCNLRGIWYPMGLTMLK
jgi:hypothetical protein